MVAVWGLSGESSGTSAPSAPTHLHAVGAGDDADVDHVEEEAVVHHALEGQDGLGGCKNTKGIREQEGGWMSMRGRDGSRPHPPVQEWSWRLQQRRQQALLGGAGSEAVQVAPRQSVHRTMRTACATAMASESSCASRIFQAIEYLSKALLVCTRLTGVRVHNGRLEVQVHNVVGVVGHVGLVA